MSTTDFDARYEACSPRSMRHTDRSCTSAAGSPSQNFDRRGAVVRLIELCEQHPLPSMSDERLSRFVAAVESVLLEEECSE